MESYQLPAVLRRVMKISKIEEKVEIVCKPDKIKRNKLLDFLPDRNLVFNRELLEAALTNHEEIKIIFEMTNLENKEHINKCAIAERLKRLTALNVLAEEFEAREIA